MDNSANRPSATDRSQPPTARTPRRAGARACPRARAGAVLAAAMLGIGIAVGAAIGPAPETSLAGDAGIAQKLPALIAAVAAHGHAQAPAPSRTTAAAHRRAVSASGGAGGNARAHRRPRRAPRASTTPQRASERKRNLHGTDETTKPAGASNAAADHQRLADPALRRVLRRSARQPRRRPLHHRPADSQGNVPDRLVGAQRERLRQRRSARRTPRRRSARTPPLLHSIVQPPCPEGAAGATCAAGTPGAARPPPTSSCKATLATITATTTYSEHGLVVVTFATVADPTAAELPAGSSSATLASQPPAGAVLLSPFAKAGARSTTTFNPTSPKQSLEKLLH